MTQRCIIKQEFLKQNDLGGATITPLPADASFRTYSRITTKDTSYLLMDSPPDKEPVENYIKIDEHLKAQGFSSPTIHAKDVVNGFLLLEDFGDDTFSHLLHTGTDPAPLYTLATETLIAMHQKTMMTALNVHPYDMPTYIREVNLFIEWFYPAITGKEISVVQKSNWEMAWITDLGKILPTRTTLVLRDFHAGNLMLLKDKKGTDKCGLLDFQDALIGHASYDILSLLEDVRLDIDPVIEQACLEQYKTAMHTGAEFDIAYTILSAQRHAKVLGIFIRLHKRDGKDKYLQYLPRTINLFHRAVCSDSCSNVKVWLDKYMPDYLEQASKFKLKHRFYNNI